MRRGNALTSPLVVRPARDAHGYAKVLWSEGHRAQVEDQQAMIPRAPALWAHRAGKDKIVYGLPGDDGTMRFRFPLRDPNYKKLVAARVSSPQATPK